MRRDGGASACPEKPCGGVFQYQAAQGRQGGKRSYGTGMYFSEFHPINTHSFKFSLAHDNSADVCAFASSASFIVHTEVPLREPRRLTRCRRGSL
jgi:hypothetical protein